MGPQEILARFCLFACFSFGLWETDLMATSQSVPPQTLIQEITAHLDQVEQFRFIRESAEKLGLRVWIFGGTASAFGHYVRWDILRKQGESAYLPEKFDYRYSSIFRSTQDCDLVIDGDEKQAQDLEKILVGQFPHLQGSKIKWELRLLKMPRGDKEALLENSDFLDQHTDSNSTGMIELTSSDFRVQDLRHWNKKSSPFLKDLSSGTIHYYFSERHNHTERYRKGLNPPIFSVIRYLTKVLQFDLQILPEDKKSIVTIIQEFSAKADLKTDYAKSWLEKNGKKLFQHAIDLEMAASILDELGIRTILKNLGDSQIQDSLSWWLNREPLRSKSISKTHLFKKSARDLEIDIVAHETINFLAFEAITKSYKGLPNVFISRSGFEAESAQYGNGFYTRRGRHGAKGTGFTIRFKVNPNAIEGEDFILYSDYVIVLNRSILTVIPESLTLSPLEYFELYANQTWNHSDHGILAQFMAHVKTLASADLESDFTAIATKLQQLKEMTISGREWMPGSLFIKFKENDSDPFIRRWIRAVFEFYPDIAPIIKKLNWNPLEYFIFLEVIQADEGTIRIVYEKLLDRKYIDSEAEGFQDIVQSTHSRNLRSAWISSFRKEKDHLKAYLKKDHLMTKTRDGLPNKYEWLAFSFWTDLIKNEVTEDDRNLAHSFLKNLGHHFADQAGKKIVELLKIFRFHELDPALFVQIVVRQGLFENAIDDFNDLNPSNTFSKNEFNSLSWTDDQAEQVIEYLHQIIKKKIPDGSVWFCLELYFNYLKRNNLDTTAFQMSLKQNIIERVNDSVKRIKGLPRDDSWEWEEFSEDISIIPHIRWLESRFEIAENFDQIYSESDRYFTRINSTFSKKFYGPLAHLKLHRKWFRRILEEPHLKHWSPYSMEDILSLEDPEIKSILKPFLQSSQLPSSYFDTHLPEFFRSIRPYLKKHPELIVDLIIGIVRKLDSFRHDPRFMENNPYWELLFNLNEDLKTIPDLERKWPADPVRFPEWMRLQDILLTRSKYLKPLKIFDYVGGNIYRKAHEQRIEYAMQRLKPCRDELLRLKGWSDSRP